MSLVWVWYLIKREMAHFVTVRQQYLISKDHSTSAQASTILVTGVPRRYLNERALAKLYAHLPGGVRKVWLNRSVSHPQPHLSPDVTPFFPGTSKPCQMCTRPG
jgi:hypothetical protein